SMRAHASDSNALRAASTAAATSSTPASATSASGSPVTGLYVVNVRPLAASTQSPPMCRRFGARRSTPISAVAMVSSRLWRAPLGRPCRPVGLPTLELRLSLLDVSGQPLARVLALEQQLLELALHGQRLGQRKLRAGLDRPLDVPHRLGRPVRRRELRGVLQHFLQEGVARLRIVDVVNDAEIPRLVELERAAGRHELDRPGLAHQPGEPLRPAR